MPTTTFRENAKRHDAIIRLVFILVHLAFVMILAIVFWTSGEISMAPLILLVGTTLMWWLISSSADRRMPRILTLDETGLAIANSWTRRSWTWAELSEAEICDRKPQTDPHVRLRVDVIDWMARWTLMESLSKSEIRLHAIYDTPLADICDRLNEYRDRAVGASTTP